ncbi:MAG: methylamine utilization protein [Gammaproteobacteria bacterium]|nr:methylamine utilization protein [Gammaproteobacteria bacterium]
MARPRIAAAAARPASNIPARIHGLLVVLCLLANGDAFGVEVSFSVALEDGSAVAEAVVLVSPADATVARPVREAVIHEIRQANEEFIPKVIVVHPGDSVAFPNDDPVMHHVYSFSPAKTFQLHLYGRDDVPSVTFDQEGVVALGCNIHDHMRGYVYVTSASASGVTGEDGIVNIPDLAPGSYQVSLWHPRLKHERAGKAIEVTQARSQTQSLVLDLRVSRLGGLDKLQRTNY